MPIPVPFLAASIRATVVLTGAQTVVIDQPRIRLADVAVRAGLPRPAWDALAGEVIATLPARARTVTLSRKAVSALITRRAPGLRTVMPANSGPIRFEVRSQPSADPALTCRRLGAERRANAQVSDGDLVPAPCTANQPADLRFNRQDHRLTAMRDLPEGSYLGRVAAPSAATVKRGDGLRLVSQVGPVTIERAVTAMQPGRNGRPMFVRDPDGEVFPVRLEQAEAEQ